MIPSEHAADAAHAWPGGLRTAAVRVLGVDACPRGWVGVVWDGTVCTAQFRGTVEELVAAAAADGPVAAVAVDIPIGLPDAGRRRADELARARLGGLRSSVFMTPVRPALRAPDHAAGSALNRTLAGEGISVQAFGMRHRIAEVEEYLTRAAVPVVEVHPEVSFAAMHGGPLTVRKATWAGADVRRELLRREGLHLAGPLGDAGAHAAVDDVLDAAAAAWTAARYAAGRARPLPDPPQVFSDGHPTAIWV